MSIRMNDAKKTTDESLRHIERMIVEREPHSNFFCVCVWI